MGTKIYILILSTLTSYFCFKAVTLTFKFIFRAYQAIIHPPFKSHIIVYLRGSIGWPFQISVVHCISEAQTGNYLMMSFGQLAFLLNAMSQCYTDMPSLSNRTFKKHYEHKMNASWYALVYPEFIQNVAEDWLCIFSTGSNKCSFQMRENIQYAHIVESPMIIMMGLLHRIKKTGLFF